MRLVPIVAGALLITALLSSACGDDDGSSASPGDERISQIGGLAELATNAFASSGSEALLDYLAQNIAENCTKEDIKRALAGHPIPTGFRTIKDVKFQGDDRASATIVLITRDGDREVQWSFIREGDQSWRIVQLPSLTEEDCAGP